MNDLVDHLFRHQAGRLVSALTRTLGLENLDLAEEVVQDAMVQALRQWPFGGIPDNPTAWLTQVARNRALDVIRRRRIYRQKEKDLEHMARDRWHSEPPSPDSALDGDLADDQLAMVFACCHPDLPPEARVALTLKSVSGFSSAEIARAFLIPEPTVAQRLVRAKRRIADQGIELAIPRPAEMASRLDSVLQVLYLWFNEGYSAHGGDDLVRHDCCAEAIRLATLLSERADTGLPKVHALLALMLFQASRFQARVDAGNNLLLFPDQDRSLWDEELIHEGLRQLDLSAEGNELTEYHVQAAIAAHHATAPSDADTDWPAVLALYDQLLAIAPSPVVSLNRAVALAMVDGPEAGLAALAPLLLEPSLRDYYLLPAVRADLLSRLGRNREAEACYRQALDCPCSEPERRFLRRRLDELA